MKKIFLLIISSCILHVNIFAEENKSITERSVTAKNIESSQKEEVLHTNALYDYFLLLIKRSVEMTNETIKKEKKLSDDTEDDVRLLFLFQ